MDSEVFPFDRFPLPSLKLYSTLSVAAASCSLGYHILWGCSAQLSLDKLLGHTSIGVTEVNIPAANYSGSGVTPSSSSNIFFLSEDDNQSDQEKLVSQSLSSDTVIQHLIFWVRFYDQIAYKLVEAIGLNCNLQKISAFWTIHYYFIHYFAFQKGLANVVDYIFMKSRTNGDCNESVYIIC